MMYYLYACRVLHRLVGRIGGADGIGRLYPSVYQNVWVASLAYGFADVRRSQTTYR
jgi:hypothetical protein